MDKYKKELEMWIRIGEIVRKKGELERFDKLYKNVLKWR